MFETDVGGAVGVEYVAVPVVGDDDMVLSLDGLGAGSKRPRGLILNNLADHHYSCNMPKAWKLSCM